MEKLRTDLLSYSKDVQELREALAATKRTPQKVPPPLGINEEVLEKLRRSIVCSVGTMIDARFAGIEERLLPAKNMRPPLAADSRRPPLENLPKAVAPSTTSVIGSETEIRRRPRRNKTIVSPEVRESASVSNSLLEPEVRTSTTQQSIVVESREEEGGTWTTVVKKGKKSKKSSRVPVTKTTVPVKPRPKVAKPPRTKAVIITLTEEAVVKGVSYAQALERAQQSVNLVQLGITEGLTVRQATSGARLLELSAAHSSEQADELAKQLQVVLDGVAVVTRPRKNATLKLSGLDDSVTKEKVASAVVNASGCTIDAITVSELRLGPRGMMTAVVRCPCEYAEIIATKGRILVGWSAAKIQVLEERPLRCYRCLALGHARPQCPSTIVREHLCFRCGCEGHKSYTCRAEPRCMICTDAKRPSGHLMGGAECRPPPVKRSEALETRASSRVCGHQVEDESAMSS